MITLTEESNLSEQSDVKKIDSNEYDDIRNKKRVFMDAPKAFQTGIVNDGKETLDINKDNMDDGRIIIGEHIETRQSSLKKNVSQHLKQSAQSLISEMSELNLTQEGDKIIESTFKELEEKSLARKKDNPESQSEQNVASMGNVELIRDKNHDSFSKLNIEKKEDEVQLVAMVEKKLHEEINKEFITDQSRDKEDNVRCEETNVNEEKVIAEETYVDQYSRGDFIGSIPLKDIAHPMQSIEHVKSAMKAESKKQNVSAENEITNNLSMVQENQEEVEAEENEDQNDNEEKMNGTGMDKIITVKARSSNLDNANVIDDTGNSLQSFGTLEKLENPIDNKSVVDEIASLFSKSFRRRRVSKASTSHDCDEDYFVNKMRDHETFYVTDIHHKDKPTIFNIYKEERIDDKRIIVSAAIVEVTSFVRRMYKNYKLLDITEENKDKPGEVTGYKPQSKAIILHNIATHIDYRERGYATFLLHSVASRFKNQGVYIYCPYPGEEGSMLKKKIYDPITFLCRLGFETDKKKKNYNIHIVDLEKKVDEPMTRKESELYRCHTSTLRCLDIETRMYGSAKVLKVEKNVISKVICTSELEETENIDLQLKRILNKGTIEVSKKKFKEHFFIGKRKEQDNRKRDFEKMSEAETMETKLDDTTIIRLKKKSTPSKTLSETESEDDSNDEGNVKGVELTKTALYGHNAHYGWQPIAEGMVHKSLVALAVEHPNQILKVRAGGRKRLSETDSKKETDSTFARIKRKFQISSTEDPLYGSCQWIAAAMLIDNDDENVAQAMMDLLRKSPDNFIWKMMYKGKNNLSEMLQKVTKYQLLKVNWELRKNQRNHINFLLTNASGKYVCLLQDSNYSETHVVGIDCSSSPKLIWDCSESEALLLSKQNLDRCTGENTLCMAINTIGEIVLKEKMKKRYNT